jgi:hydrogenase maturation protein HypF
MGRVFDAAAGLLGICPRMEFEAQAAIALEQSATAYIEAHGWPAPLDDGWRIDANGELDLLPLLGALSSEPDAAYGAALFHATLVAALLHWVARAAEASGIARMACGGGCFSNKLCATGLERKNSADRAGAADAAQAVARRYRDFPGPGLGRNSIIGKIEPCAWPYP